MALLRGAVQERSAAEQHVIDAIRAARASGMSWSAIGAFVGTSGEAAASDTQARSPDSLHRAPQKRPVRSVGPLTRWVGCVAGLFKDVTHPETHPRSGRVSYVAMESLEGSSVSVEPAPARRYP